jgi:hypothetical protein
MPPGGRRRRQRQRRITAGTLQAELVQVPLVFMNNLEFPTLGENANLRSADGAGRQEQTLEVNKGQDSMQEFEGTSGIGDDNGHTVLAGDALKILTLDEQAAAAANAAATSLDCKMANRTGSGRGVGRVPPSDAARWKPAQQQLHIAEVPLAASALVEPFWCGTGGRGRGGSRSRASRAGRPQARHQGLHGYRRVHGARFAHQGGHGPRL